MEYDRLLLGYIVIKMYFIHNRHAEIYTIATVINVFALELTANLS